MRSTSDDGLISLVMLTSVKHSPYVDIRKPSSPLGIGEHKVVIEDECPVTYFVGVWSDSRLRSEIVLYLLSDNFPVDVPGWYPVLVLFRIRHWINVCVENLYKNI